MALVPPHVCASSAFPYDMKWTMDRQGYFMPSGGQTPNIVYPTFRGVCHARFDIDCSADASGSKPHDTGKLAGVLLLTPLTDGVNPITGKPTDPSEPHPDRQGSGRLTCVKCQAMRVDTNPQRQGGQLGAIVNRVPPSTEVRFKLEADCTGSDGAGMIWQATQISIWPYRTPDVFLCLEPGNEGMFCYLHLDCAEGPPCYDDPATFVRGPWRRPRRRRPLP